MPWFSIQSDSISRVEVEDACRRLLEEARTRLRRDFRRVLLLPPDLTRAHSGAGWIAETIYTLLPASCDIHVIPTLGQHVPHTEEENKWMFGSIPNERIHEHDWRAGVTRIGTIPATLVAETTGGKADWEIPVELNTSLIQEQWDLIISIGHVVPHEVLGFANHNKNYFIGLGGKNMICASHLAAGVYGIENYLGKLITPLRACYNWGPGKYRVGKWEVAVGLNMTARSPDGSHLLGSAVPMPKLVDNLRQHLELSEPTIACLADGNARRALRLTEPPS